MTADTSSGEGAKDGFSDRVIVFFMAQVLTAGLGIVNGILLARLIGPSAKGDYYLLTLLPTTLLILCQLGLPQAFGFYSARDLTRGIVMRAIVLTALLSIPVLLVLLAILPALDTTLFHGLEPILVVLPLIALPFFLSATFTTGIVVGRQAARWLAIVNIGVSLTATPMIIVLVGVLDLGIWGAISAFLLTAVVQAMGFLIGARAVTHKLRPVGSASYRQLFEFGIPFYPTSLTQFFAYRADVYLIAWLLADPSAPLGYYSIAVAMAELVFFFPNAVSTFFFPHVASTTREESDRQVPLTSRVTLLLTALVGLLLVPVATVAIDVLLPAFEPALPALYVLLPGVVAISVSKVLSGYLAGLGRTGLTSVISTMAFVVNVVLNLYLIPHFGIVGASAASLISYTLSSVVYSIVAAGLAHASPWDFWIPRRSDIRVISVTVMGMWKRVLAGSGRLV